MLTFGEKLKILRRTYSLTQKEVGKAIGVSDRAISDWEQKRKKPSNDNITSIEKLFYPYCDILRDSPSNSENLKRKQRYDVIFRLWDMCEKRLDEYTALPFVNSEIANEMYGIEKEYYWESDHIIVAEFVRCLRKKLKKNLITLQGEFQNLFLANIMGATQFNQVETKYICPKCKSEEVFFYERKNKITCRNCGIPKVNVRQECSILCHYSQSLLPKYLLGPLVVIVSVPDNVFGKVCQIAMSFFSLMLDPHQSLTTYRGKKCLEVHLSHVVSDRTRYPSFEFNPDDYCITLKIVADKQNQNISDMLRDSEPNLTEIYSPSNIQSLAQKLKKYIPMELQKDVSSIERIDQLTNLLILIENKGDDCEGKITPEVFRELQSKMNIARWPDIPLTNEEYWYWVQDNEQFWRNHSVEELYHTNRMGYGDLYCGRYSKGLYSEVIYRALLANLFGFDKDE